MLRNWQNKGNIFFVYNLLLVVIVMENVIQSGKSGRFCHFIFYQGFLSQTRTICRAVTKGRRPFATHSQVFGY